VLTDASNNETRPSAEILEARPETTSDLETTKKPAGSFTAKIDELTRQNLALMTELVTICHIRSPLMNLTGCEIRFVLFGLDGRVTEWSLTELEQWRSTASKAEALNRELGASLDAARLRMNALQQEKGRMKESCRQNAIAANFFRITAVEADAAIRELFGAFESIKAKIPAVCPDSESYCFQLLHRNWRDSLCGGPGGEGSRRRRPVVDGPGL
jgi:hypothetical protein